MPARRAAFGAGSQSSPCAVSLQVGRWGWGWGREDLWAQQGPSPPVHLCGAHTCLPTPSPAPASSPGSLGRSRSRSESGSQRRCSWLCEAVEACAFRGFVRCISDVSVRAHACVCVCACVCVGEQGPGRDTARGSWTSGLSDGPCERCDAGRPCHYLCVNTQNVEPDGETVWDAGLTLPKPLCFTPLFGATARSELVTRGGAQQGRTRPGLGGTAVRRLGPATGPEGAWRGFCGDEVRRWRIRVLVLLTFMKNSNIRPEGGWLGASGLGEMLPAEPGVPAQL